MAAERDILGSDKHLALRKMCAAPLMDNNLSERLLRIIALGRKNIFFLGNDEAGEHHLDTLQSLVSPCQLNAVNPAVYLKDVLIRIAKGHPQGHLDELLPHNCRDLDSR
jgi:transposase